ncbi:purine-cytosine permease family protein [Companilactobacillus halodurans]|uniref:Cytosine permease n=1 Tax=Companilactobacillus halodurans TaxID=2584183 RepID=A0A5P0ZQ00_9LACO|nr:cytosine permease [Companilactobacillus halodurans]MQS76327.1 cytosine permease [Companilactobacillus halodurans]MQS98181.1 cytosine permease [Companilactobacillus halodurans]
MDLDKEDTPATQTSSEGTFDDYSTQRVPDSEREPMWKILMVQIGGFVCLSQFMLGAELGYGMTFRDAVLSTIIGSVILQFIAYGLGLAGQKEGLATSLLSKWSGFGTIGSAVVSLTFAISLIGWFGIQNSVFAQGIVSIIGNNANFGVVSTITGLAVTLSVIFGFKGLSWTTNISVPAFIVVIGVAVYNMLKGHTISGLITMAAPGAAMTLSSAITMVTGNFIVGAIIMPDLTRRSRNSKDVFWICVIGTLVGELGVNVIGVLMAHAVGTSKIMPIIYQLTGLFGIALIVLSSVKVNDLNLYSASLNIVNFFKQVFHISLNRAWVTIVAGCVGTFLSVIGLIDKFSSFLTVLGVIFPPVASIMFVDYWILKRDRKSLKESHEKNSLPEDTEKFPIVTIVAWIGGSLVGYFVNWGIQSITVIIASGLIYYVGMKLFGKKNLAVTES